MITRADLTETALPPTTNLDASGVPLVPANFTTTSIDAFLQSFTGFGRSSLVMAGDTYEAAMAFTTGTQGGDTTHTTGTKQQLTLAVNALAATTIHASTETELLEYTRLARTASRRVEHLLVQIAHHADRLHSQGRSGSPEDVLGGDGDVSRRKAKEEAERAKAAAAAPGLADALGDGDISGEHLDALARAKRSLTKEQQEHFNIERLTALALELGPDEFAEAVRQAIEQAKNDWGLGKSIEDRQKSRFSLWRDKHTGMGRINGWLDPERFDAFRTQVEDETSSLAASRKNDPGAKSGNVSKDEHLAMDALVSLVEKGSGANAGASARPTIILHVDSETAMSGPHHGPTAMCQTDSGHHVPPETIQRFLCDAVIQPVLMKNGLALKAGRKARTATDAQISVLKAMYDTCAWHGCTTEIGWCQMHHVKFWENGGDTDLSNLVPLCSHHHHKVHDEHWGLHLAADRMLSIKKPTGETWRTSQPGRIRPQHMAPDYRSAAYTPPPPSGPRTRRE